MSDKFRIQSVEIEGFRGFTVPQTIILDGKTAFVFGPNSFGKTSLAAAIVWCLFGSEQGKDAVVKNVYYRGACKVDLVLTRGSEKFIFSRRLYSSGSEPKIRDSKGNEIKRQDILPPFKKLGHGEGAHVIFAQQENAQRYVKDISDFEGVIAAYLGLDKAKLLIEMISDTMLAQAQVKDSLQLRRESFRKSLEELDNETSEKITATLQNPPWSGDIPPTREATILKLNKLKEEVLKISGGAIDDNDGPVKVLDKISELLETPLNEEKIKRAIDDKASERQKISEFESRLTGANKKLRDIGAGLLAETNKITILLNSENTESIKTKLASLKENTSKKDDLSKIYELVLAFINKYESNCPVCKGDVPSDELKTQLDLFTNENGFSYKEINRLEKLLKDVEECEEKINELTRDKTEAERNLVELKKQIRCELGLEEDVDVSEEVIGGLLTQLTLEIESLQEELKQESERVSGFKTRLKLLRDEVKYQNLLVKRRKIEELQSSQDLASVELRLGEFITRLRLLTEMKNRLETCYQTALRLHLPSVNKRFSDTYKTLTGQRSFEGAEIRVNPSADTQSNSGFLKVYVGSDADGWHDPSLVLNGQAKNALNLVPYFSFSSLNMLNHELDFLLIDDPSQTFDNSHAEKLIDLLQLVSDHAQIIVATHDEVRFNPEGKIADVKVIRVTDFDRHTGPKIR